MTRPSLQTRPKAPASVFLAATVLIFFLSLSAADSVGFVPSYIDGSSPAGESFAANEISLADLPQLGEADTAPVNAPARVALTALPVRINISSVGIDLPVQNPKTTEVGALDALLKKGPARYADSARLGENGNVVLFAHSSHLPIVRNKMYQAFNNIPDAQAGDIVILTGSDGREYIYSVDSVVKASTNDGTTIPLTAAGAKLTLVTCDTLTGKSARYILTASFVGTD
ncbi:MAG TPA: sortase [Candidatus Paceibacterota bacterium]